MSVRWATLHRSYDNINIFGANYLKYLDVKCKEFLQILTIFVFFLSIVMWKPLHICWLAHIFRACCCLVSPNKSMYIHLKYITECAEDTDNSNGFKLHAIYYHILPLFSYQEGLEPNTCHLCLCLRLMEHTSCNLWYRFRSGQHSDRRKGCI